MIPILTKDEYHDIAAEYYNKFKFVPAGYDSYCRDPEFSSTVISLQSTNSKNFTEDLITARKQKAIKIVIDLPE